LCGGGHSHIRFATITRRRLRLVAGARNIHGEEMNNPGLSEQQIISRIERLPVSRWYARILGTVAMAHFFDAFDSLTIAFILPVLVGLWKINPSEIGLLISAGFAGQLIGALALGWAAEKYGRRRVLQISLIIIALFSAACALAWDYTSLLGFRLLQGIGLGAEVPVAATYLNEFTRAAYRGRFLLLLQWMFAIGVAVTSAVATWLVPAFGWQSMFWLGVLPAVLALGLRWLIPESPRWLAGQGRLAEADEALSGIEAEVERVAAPPPEANLAAISHERAGWKDLFEGIYLRRTFCAWTIAFCTSFIGYGLITWLPTIFRTVYQLPVPQALSYGLIINMVGLAGPLVCMLLIDTLGRRGSFVIAFVGGGLCMIGLWYIGAGRTSTEVLILGAIAYFFLAFLLTGVYVYIPETYPTRMRALGTGTASSFLRIASIVGPTIVGFTLSNSNVGIVFLMFGLVSLFGALVVALFTVETRGKILEVVSP
jgi:MFS transporter, putative metabolite:H+ symporter